MSSSQILTAIDLGALAGLTSSVNPAVIEMMIAVAAFLIVAFIIYDCDYIQTYSYKWVILLGIVLLIAGKLLNYERNRKNKIMYWWNIIYVVLLFIGLLLLTQTRLSYEQDGAILILFCNFVDIFLEIYSQTVHGKSTASDETKPAEEIPEVTKTESVEDKAKMAFKKAEMNPAIGLGLVAVGDLLMAFSFVYALYQSTT